MLDIDAAIKHCEEVARNCEDQASQCDVEDRYERHVMYENAKCAADHRQLAEWLKELKEAKRLLKAAVEDIKSYVDCYEAHCDECCCSQDNHCHWKYEAEALKLIGETNEP